MDDKNTTSVPSMSPEVQMLKRNRDEAFLYKQRRLSEWNETYDLYRDKVQINRLIQRQSVHIPIMKGQIRTLLKDVDDMPVIYFENLDNDKQAELFKNEYWKEVQRENRMDLLDIVDKRQVLLFGRSFDQWQISEGHVEMSICDPVDISLSRYMKPYNIHSSNFLIHSNIFIPLSQLVLNTDYDVNEVNRLKTYFGTKAGLIKKEDNYNQLQEKNQKMADMGVPDTEAPILGETYVELELQFVRLFDEDGDIKEDEDGNKVKTKLPPQIFLFVIAEQSRVLLKTPLEKHIGVTEDHYWRNHYPYCSWADDLELQDVWSDAVGDIIRGSNKIIDVFYSQLVENRTLRNFGMHYYNSNLENFVPQTMEPRPWGWYPIPVPANGNIDSVMKKVDVPDLSESIDETAFVINQAEKASGATAGQQGVASERQITLGEFKATLTEAKERTKGMSKFYTPVWEQRGEMFVKLLEAAGDRLDAVKIYRKGRNTDQIYAREISDRDWRTRSGYRCRVWSQDEKDAMDVNTLQKQNAVKQAMPNNPKVTEIYQRRLLEWAGYKPEEINDIMQMEQEQRTAMMEALQNQSGITGLSGVAPSGGTPGATGVPPVNPPSSQPAQPQPLAA